MAYATQADLVPLRLTLQDLIELTTDDDVSVSSDDWSAFAAAYPDTAAKVTTVMNAALDEASQTVDGYCGQRYATPLQPSGIVKAVTLDLAIYALATRRRETKPTETWSERRDQAMVLLRDVSSGRASLDQPATAVQPQASSASVTTSTRRLTFDDDNLRGFC